MTEETNNENAVNSSQNDKTKKVAAKKAAPKNTTAKKSATSARKTKATAERPTDSNSKNQGENTDTPEGLDQMKLNDIKDRDWSTYLKRAVYMIFFGFLGWFAMSVAVSLTFIQFILTILSGKPHDQVTGIISALGIYIGDVLTFMSYKTDETPFPLDKGFPDLS